MGAAKTRAKRTHRRSEADFGMSLGPHVKGFMDIVSFQTLFCVARRKVTFRINFYKKTGQLGSLKLRFRIGNHEKYTFRLNRGFMKLVSVFHVLRTLRKPLF